MSFLQDILPPLSYKTYFVRQGANLSSPSPSPSPSFSGRVATVAKETSVFDVREDIIIGTAVSQQKASVMKPPL